MKLSHGLAAVVLTLSAAAVHAEVTGTVTATTDYDFRGVTQTAHDPALQGSIDYAHESGFYASVWASNVDFGGGYNENVETDVTVGWSGGETVTWDVGGVYYLYPGAHDLAFPEVYAGATWNVLTGKIFYTWDYGQSGKSAEYYQLDAGIPLPASLTLNLHGGYSDGSYWGSDNYFDWSAGLSYELGHFTLDLKWVDGSDLAVAEHVWHDIASSEARAIFTVSTSFPWTKE